MSETRVSAPRQVLLRCNLWISLFKLWVVKFVWAFSRQIVAWLRLLSVISKSRSGSFS